MSCFDRFDSDEDYWLRRDWEQRQSELGSDEACRGVRDVGLDAPDDERSRP